MDWWQIVLIILTSIVVGLLVGGFVSYLILRLQRKPFFKKRETAAVAKEQLKSAAPLLRINLGNGLIALNLLAWVLILFIIFFPSNILRIILGIPFLLFFPGYALMAALFTKKEGMGGTERVALSFGLSIAVVPLIGLILNYTPLGIRLEPILYSIASFILITSIIAWLRRRRLTEHERFAIQFQVTMPGWPESVWDRVLAITLVIVILGALGTLGYVIATPKAGETFTEFYILGQEGKAANYPQELKVGDEGRVIVGIVNHEGREVSYRVRVVTDGKGSAEVGPVVLVDEQKWEGELSFMLEVVGENQRVQFLLYKDDEIEPCLEPLHLWVDVKE